MDTIKKIVRSNLFVCVVIVAVIAVLSGALGIYFNTAYYTPMSASVTEGSLFYHDKFHYPEDDDVTKHDEVMYMYHNPV